VENLTIRCNKLDIGVKVVFLRNKPVEVENNTIAQNKPDKLGFQLRIQVKNSSEWFISQFGRSINFELNASRSLKNISSSTPT